MSDDLKPCPFCGGSAKHYHQPDFTGWSNTDWVSCSGDCGASTCMHETKDQAVNAWNTRAALRAQIEAAVKRAIEGAAQEADDWFYDPEEDMVTDVRLGKAIRALNPAQFVDGDKT